MNSKLLRRTGNLLNQTIIQDFYILFSQGRNSLEIHYHHKKNEMFFKNMPQLWNNSINYKRNIFR
jgi:hypothetical protein